MAEQQVALVTGANRGLGAEIARQLADDHGFLVLAGARNPGAVAAHGGSETGGRIVAIELDVGSPASVAAARERIEADPGRLDVLVNNAAIHGPYDGVADYDLEVAREVLETNLLGAWRVTQAVLPLLRRSEHPRIVNVSSGAGQLTEEVSGGSAGYRISKAGLNMLTRALATEEREHGILVNAASPGWVRTEMGGPGAPRSVAEGADTPVWLATLPDAGPTGGFFRDREPFPW